MHAVQHPPGPTLQRADSLAAWTTVVTEAFGSTQIRSGRRDFRAVLGHCAVGGAEILRVKAPGELAEKTVTECERANPDRLLVHLQARGVSVTRQGHRSGRLTAGEAALCNPANDYAVEFASDFEMFVLRLPQVSLHSRVPGLDLGCATAQPLDTHFTQLLLAFLETAWRQAPLLAGDADWRDCVGRTTLDLLARAVQRTRLEGVHGPGQALRDAILAHVRHRLADPDLRTSTIASALGVSNRTVQAVFERMGTTASAHVLFARLEHAAARLRQGPASITHLALDLGFNDPAYFSRCFHRHYGQSPREFARRGQSPSAT